MEKYFNSERSQELVSGPIDPLEQTDPMRQTIGTYQNPDKEVEEATADLFSRGHTLDKATAVFIYSGTPEGGNEGGRGFSVAGKTLLNHNGWKKERL